MKYFDEIKRSMTWLGEQEKSIFLGQAVGVGGTFMFRTLEDVPFSKRLEFPVTESFQAQFTAGLALGGYIPCSIYPRASFLLLALADLVNTIDKLPVPKCIFITASGPSSPVWPGSQHVGRYEEAFKLMMTEKSSNVHNLEVVALEEPHDIFPSFQYAYERPDNKSTLLCLVGDYINSK